MNLKKLTDAARAQVGLQLLLIKAIENGVVIEDIVGGVIDNEDIRRALHVSSNEEHEWQEFLSELKSLSVEKRPLKWYSVIRGLKQPHYETVMKELKESVGEIKDSNSDKEALSADEMLKIIKQEVLPNFEHTQEKVKVFKPNRIIITGELSETYYQRKAHFKIKMKWDSAQVMVTFAPDDTYSGMSIFYAFRGSDTLHDLFGMNLKLQGRRSASEI